jgi:hypothetical protein
MRRASEALKHVEKREIEVIEFHHESFLHRIAEHASLLHRHVLIV